jgi:hypothetical protein
MDVKLMALYYNHPFGLRMWQETRAFYPAHIKAHHAMQVDAEYQRFGSETSPLSVSLLETTTVHNILPLMSPADFDDYMKNTSLKDWKEAFDTLPENTAKALIVMVLSRPALEHYMTAVLSEYSKDTELATRLYEVGVGGRLRQPLLKNTEQVAYYRMFYPERYWTPYAILPTLNHEHTYLDGDIQTMVRVDDGMLELKKYALLDHTQEEIFMARLFSASATTFYMQWPECWAHSLSALDHALTGNYLHDVYCHLAQSGGRSGCTLRSVLLALEHARGTAYKMEHPWQRLLVFQDLLVHWGFYNLEREVFEKGRDIIPKNTIYYYKLIRQHLKAVLHYAEDIALFQHIRQAFHAECDDERCDKPDYIEYSFLAVERLAFEIDKYSRELRTVRERAYYSGYVHYLLGFRTDSMDLSWIEKHFQQAVMYFDQSTYKKQIMGDERMIDATIMSTYLKKNTTTVFDKITKAFAELTHMQHNMEGANVLHRMLVMQSYFGMHYYAISERSFARRVFEYYKKATHNKGYRMAMLELMIESSDWSHMEDNPTNIDDMPLLGDCLTLEENVAGEVREFWKVERDCLILMFDEEVEAGKGKEPKRRRIQPQSNFALPSHVLTSKDFLTEEDVHNQTVYKFGYKAIQHNMK